MVRGNVISPSSKCVRPTTNYHRLL